MAAEPIRTRLTADERRDQLVTAAIAEFAGAGLAGASTEAIARRAGISHAYLFRLYRTKRELFLACADHCMDHVRAAFELAYEQRDPDAELLPQIGAAYLALIEDRDELLFQLHVWASCGDDDIRELARTRYLQLFDWVRTTAGVTEAETWEFMATGMMLAVGTALGEPRLKAHPDAEPPA